MPQPSNTNLSEPTLRHRPRSHGRRATSWPKRSLVAVLAATVLASASACTPTGGPDQPAGPPSSTSSAIGAMTTYDAATRDDAAFNQQFQHKFADVDGVRMHYVTGGTGPALVLLHGWPQTWYEWRDIMPELAQNFTVYAVDLPGLGDSEGAPTSYDKATLARYLHTLLNDQLGLSTINLVGHDLGAGVGFQYAAQFPGQVERYAHLDFPLVGPALTAQTYRTYSWHLAFHEQDAIPEMLVDDDVRSYLAAFYPQVAYGGTAFGGKGAPPPFSRQQIDEFARTYSRPDALSGGFDLYRTLDQDELDNKAAGPITVPTLLLAAEGTLASMRATTNPLLANVDQAAEVPRSGHWLATENPKFVAKKLLGYFTS